MTIPATPPAYPPHAPAIQVDATAVAKANAYAKGGSAYSAGGTGGSLNVADGAVRGGQGGSIIVGGTALGPGGGVGPGNGLGGRGGQRGQSSYIGSGSISNAVNFDATSPAPPVYGAVAHGTCTVLWGLTTGIGGSGAGGIGIPHAVRNCQLEQTADMALRIGDRDSACYVLQQMEGLKGRKVCQSQVASAPVYRAPIPDYDRKAREQRLKGIGKGNYTPRAERVQLRNHVAAMDLEHGGWQVDLKGYAAPAKPKAEWQTLAIKIDSMLDKMESRHKVVQRRIQVHGWS
jgi:hypothetical protein